MLLFLDEFTDLPLFSSSLSLDICLLSFTCFPLYFLCPLTSSSYCFSLLFPCHLLISCVLLYFPHLPPVIFTFSLYLPSPLPTHLPILSHTSFSSHLSLPHLLSPSFSHPSPFSFCCPALLSTFLLPIFYLLSPPQPPPLPAPSLCREAKHCKANPC